MKRKLLLPFWVLFISVFTATVSHAGSLPTAPIYNPPAIQVPAGTTLEAVRKAVRKGLYLKEWQITDAGPDRLAGLFRKGDKYSINIEVEYSAKSVNIQYKDSTGLSYDAGIVHRTYNERVFELEKAIRAELDAF
jgi:hypothetical protein